MYYEKVGEEEEDKTTRKRPGNSYDLFKIIFWITMNPLCKYPVQKERASACNIRKEIVLLDLVLKALRIKF